MIAIAVSSGKYKAFIDESDFDLISKYKWCSTANRNGKRYATTRIYVGSKYTYISMHRLIMGFPEKGLQVDHINHNGLDNRRSNLRVVTRKQNQYNRLPKQNGTSKYIGVSLNKRSGLYTAQIGLGNKKTKSLGRFTNEIDAAKAYNKAALELRGEYASINKF